jgi:hypothetical protein
MAPTTAISIPTLTGTAATGYLVTVSSDCTTGVQTGAAIEQLGQCSVAKLLGLPYINSNQYYQKTTAATISGAVSWLTVFYSDAACSTVLAYNYQVNSQQSGVCTSGKTVTISDTPTTTAISNDIVTK